jgi:hypothetical protein
MCRTSAGPWSAAALVLQQMLLLLLLLIAQQAHGQGEPPKAPLGCSH